MGYDTYYFQIFDKNGNIIQKEPDIDFEYLDLEYLDIDNQMHDLDGTFDKAKIMEIKDILAKKPDELPYVVKHLDKMLSLIDKYPQHRWNLYID